MFNLSENEEDILQQLAKVHKDLSEDNCPIENKTQLYALRAECLKALLTLGHAGAGVELGDCYNSQVQLTYQYPNRIIDNQVALEYYQKVMVLSIKPNQEQSIQVAEQRYFNLVSALQHEQLQEIQQKEQEALQCITELKQLDKLIDEKRQMSSFTSPLNATYQGTLFNPLLLSLQEVLAKRYHLLYKLHQIGHAGATLELGDSVNPLNKNQATYQLNTDAQQALIFYQQAQFSPLGLFQQLEFHYPHPVYGQRYCMNEAKQQFDRLSNHLIEQELQDILSLQK